MAPVPKIRPRRPVRVYLTLWREHVGLTQQQVADRMGVTKGTISRWETTRRVPSHQTLAAYAEALGKRMGDLYRRPADGPSLDAMAAEVSPELRQQIVDIVRAITRHVG